MRLKFNSIFRSDMQTYMELRMCSMSKNTYRLDGYRLMFFDRFLCDKDHKEELVSEKDINEWLIVAKVPQASLEGYIKTIRGFMKFRGNQGNPVYMPPYRKKTDTYVPYIFTAEEMGKIILCADSMRAIMPRLVLPYIYAEIPVILRLLYCNGLRLGEALQIRISDIDFEHGVIKIVHAKRNKQRLVPLHSSLQSIIFRYCMALGIIGQPDAYIFPGKTFDTHISDLALERNFKKILQHLGIINGNENIHERGPCLHCFRHCFMLNSFKQLEAAGYTVDISSPYLSVYCGHESLLESEKYMKFSSEMFRDEMLCFESFIEDFLPEVDL